jgi:succinate dehydrogenase / fumarate reductase cytochrome b subunit
MVEEIETAKESQTETGSKISNLLKWFNPFSHGVGMWAWAIQRLTGLLLILYLINHFAIIGLMILDPTGALYNGITAAMNTPLLTDLGMLGPFELAKATSIGFMIDAGLIAVMIYHGFNGIRVIWFDVAPDSVRNQKVIFWILFVLGVIVWIVSLSLILIVPEIVIIGE